LYDPSTQWLHEFSILLLNATLHTQSDSLLLAGGEFVFILQFWHESDAAATNAENFPAIQCVHSASPFVILYLPASHGKQVSSSFPVNPEMH